MAKGIPLIQMRPLLGSLGARLGWLLAPLRALEAERGYLLPFGLVAFGCGILTWFSAKVEPNAVDYLIFSFIALLAMMGRIWGAYVLHIPFGFVFAFALGFLASGIRAHWVEAAQLNFRYYGAIEGRVVEIDRSSSDALRVTLDQVVLERLAPLETPAHVRVSLHAPKDLPFAPYIPNAGETIMLTGHLMPPAPPVEPGGFDFRRMAYFDQLGAVGYSRNPVMVLEPAAPHAEWIGRLRHILSQGIRDHIPGQAGAFAAGAMTGDRSAISQATVVALRDSSLAHILAISGMNLAVLVSFTFGLIRGGVALWPYLALRVNSRKIAAVLSLGVAYFYLLLSGGNVATERAFYMVAIMLGAVLLDRRALSLHTAAVAGLFLLALQPESLLEPGFQMSFAATVALIAGFEVLRSLWPEYGFGWPNWLKNMVFAVVAMVASTVIGGIATAPFAALHFNRFAEYGFWANFLTVPVMGITIMPMGVLAMLLAPLGLAFVPLMVMGWGAQWILFVAHYITGLEGAVWGLVSPRPWALALVCFGGIWLIAWRRPSRLWGILPILLGGYFWLGTPRPGLLISADTKLVGLMGVEGRSLSSGSTAELFARNWLERDGDLTSPELAAQRVGFDGPKAIRRFQFGGLKMVVLSGKQGREYLPTACLQYDLVIGQGSTGKSAAEIPQGCPLITEKMLRPFGSLAFWQNDGGDIRLDLQGVSRRIWQADEGNMTMLRAVLPKAISINQAQ